MTRDRWGKHKEEKAQKELKTDRQTNRSLVRNISMDE